MIYLLVLLDVLISNYTKYTSYFFVIYLYNKPYKYYLLCGLLLDLVIFNSYLFNTIILSLMFLINKIFEGLNKNNIYNYAFINIFNYLLYIILTNLSLLNSINNILILIGNNLIINILFYILCYRVYKNSKNY